MTSNCVQIWYTYGRHHELYPSERVLKYAKEYAALSKNAAKNVFFHVFFQRDTPEFDFSGSFSECLKPRSKGATQNSKNCRK